QSAAREGSQAPRLGVQWCPLRGHEGDFRSIGGSVFRVKNSPRFCWIAVAAMLSILCGACGSSSSNTLSQAQAQAVTEQLSHALDQALTTAITSNALAEKAVHPSLATVVKDIHSDQSSPCTTTATGKLQFPSLRQRRLPRWWDDRRHGGRRRRLEQQRR